MLSDGFAFAQIMDHLPWSIFQQCVTRYDGDKHVKAFTCSDQYRCMAFAQLTYRVTIQILLSLRYSFRRHEGFDKLS